MLSDRVRRKQCLIAGLLIFIVGCIGSYFSVSIELLIASRLIQSIGCSVCSVVGQTISRDSFTGPKLRKVYSVIGLALAVFPAIGPRFGAFICQKYG